MESKLNGLAISKGVSTDDVVRTIQALISAGYKGDELLEKIDEIYGVGARNNLLKVVNYVLPTGRTTVTIEYPEISPSEKTKIGDILVGSNGFIGQITEISFDSDNVVSSITVLGLGYDIIESVLPDVTAEDNNKALIVSNGEWGKDYIRKTKDIVVDGSIATNGIFSFEDRNFDNFNSGRTNRSVYLEPLFVPYTAEDISLSLRFSDDNDRDIRLMGVRLPKYNTDVANKAYVDHEATKYISVTHSELMGLRNDGDLIPGCQYRITDYVATVDGVAATVEAHPFDIIVTADSTNELNENARACMHDGDNYYSVNRSNLSAWELKYCLDNDTSKFDWADASGTGVVYFLKDDYGNECPYDFKQIKFETYRIDNCAVQSLIGKYCPNLHINDSSKITYDNNDVKYLFTFSKLVNGEYVDGSVVNDAVQDKGGLEVKCQNNVIKECYRRTASNVQYLNSIVFVYDSYPVYSNYFDFDCSDMFVCDSSYGNTFGKFSFGNAFGNDFSNNKIGNNCANIIFGKQSTGNVIENNCSDLSFGNYCINNTFKSGCNNIEFRVSNSFDSSLADRFSNNIIDNGNCYMLLWSETESYPVKNYIFLPGIVGTNNNKEVIELTRNLNCCTFIGQYE